jgi:UDP-N-acetylmuramate dehydrogenase
MAPRDSEIIKSLGKERVKLNEPLAKQTTFGIGGPAAWFYEAKTQEELIKAVKLARKLKIPFFILGSGSNLLVSDKGWRGLVIKVKSQKSKVKGTEIIADAGVILAKLVQVAADNSLAGLEIGAGIPGTIGGALVGNAGTGDQWLGDLVESVEIINEAGRIQKLTREDCQFGYRTSRFKTTKEIILRVILLLEKNDPPKIKQRIEVIMAKRKNQPQEKSAGSIFKNPPDRPAGQLIEEAGLKGKRIGQAQISPQHANFIVNLGGARADDVLRLIKLAKAVVKKKFGIELEEEICLLGFAKI